jgi:hypothetical protein
VLQHPRGGRVEQRLAPPGEAKGAPVDHCSIVEISHNENLPQPRG